MIAGGVSCKGSYHELNQDYYICSSVGNGYVLVVSDGMGSKKYSQIGAKTICEVIYEKYKKSVISLRDISWIHFLQDCHSQWINSLDKYDINQCCATMIVLIIQNDHLKAARLGDGFLSIQIDNQVHMLMDKKAEYFANETDCLASVFDKEHVEVFEADFDIFSGAVACTDGIEIGTMKTTEITNFTKEFVSEYSQMGVTESETEIKGWISDWPGNDDKTLAYLISEGVANESTI